ncbi:MAG: acetyltransferase [Anaerolineae bacterium]|nr:acetyltransferase [Anaerolineae bacterium]
MAVKAIGFGAGGHARVIIEILRFDGSYDLVGLLDPGPELRGLDVLGVPVLGGDDLLPELVQHGIVHFFVGLGGAGNNLPRQHLYEKALQHIMQPLQAIHPRAIISPFAEIGVGAIIMAGAVVNTCSRLGQNVIVNTNAVVEHDCIIGDHVHIAPGALLASAVRVESGAHVGIGAVIHQGLTIGEKAVIGAGAVVVEDVLPNTVVVGVPARRLYGEK